MIGTNRKIHKELIEGKSQNLKLLEATWRCAQNAKPLPLHILHPQVAVQEQTFEREVRLV
jgi:hypothetical protein